ncbi:MAG TPA: hypothetical protein VNF07_13610 [Acidimicrobiales bacterium]|nr:hypothetical protein [Acidimicrobiales bacterium]
MYHPRLLRWARALVTGPPGRPLVVKGLLAPPAALLLPSVPSRSPRGPR